MDTNKVLTLDNGNIGFETKETPINAKQKWTWGAKDDKGWRTIQHSESGKYLTTRYKKPSSLLTLEDLGKCTVGRVSIFVQAIFSKTF